MKNIDKHFATRRRVPFIEQMQQTECGLCCMAMIVAYYKSHISLYELRERMGNGRDGTTLLHLKQMAEQLGFDTKSYRANAESLHQMKLPAILYWNENHFVILEKVTPKHFIIVDPGSGRQKMTKEEFSKSFSGYLLTLTPNENFKIRKGKSVWRSFSHLVTSRSKIFFTILFLTFLLQLFTVLMPILIQYVIDVVIVPENSSMLDIFLLGIVGLVVFHTLFTYLRGRILITLYNELDYDMQTNFFKHILKLPYQFFLLRSFGDLLFRAGSMKVVRDQLANQLVRGILDIAILAVILLYMVIQSPLMGLIVSVISLTNIFIIGMSRKYLSEINQKEILAHAEVQGAQTEMLYGIFGVKTSGVEKTTYHQWLDQFKSLLSAYRNKETILNYINTASSTLQISAPLIILWVGAYQVSAGNITLGVLVGFHAISNQFFILSRSVVDTINSFILTSGYLKRIEDVLDAPEEENETKPKMKLEGNIRLENVAFSYTKYSPNVIDGVSLDVKKGQKVAIVGKSGSGKSTLGNIIIGLFKPKTGNVYYDGKSVHDLDLQHLRQQIGTVPQDVTLFNRSIYENITLHNQNASPEQVVQVAKVAQIHDEIMDMPMQYNTMVSEMGMNLSGGQRQRIALAKALLGNPAVLLLDEATSSLDHLNEGKIDEYLSSINCTRIVIAHRLTTIMNSDLIVVIENGKIVETGTHHELMKKSKFYNNYYSEMIS
ncbi:peptidase domain-containing ABC transporter [Amphibacillus sp. MSJ-3]|uniref:peptidase domain-containing ABC transporter n=1 Tax=Amphibacillus sp. MSJ-3 TaxID=2841505 RepID=UPI001C0ECBD6|nr:peptidase domain-containing ABC transporter [Amphibacillus sp. MSJ-3]MBU5594547.1 peptidase domain-containing ABC transporter [Amphibacillus sp. MSJ-3]